MIDQNKTFKTPKRYRSYFLYALGEIILVVVGILIALQINNWNERRKDRILEKYYLNRLVADLKADIVEIDETVRFAGNAITLGNEILEELGHSFTQDVLETSDPEVIEFWKNSIDLQNSDIQDKTFGQTIGLLTDERIVDLNNFTYNELVSTGKFEVIKDPQLRESISNYYLKFTAILDIQDNLLKSVDQFNEALMENNVPMVNSMTNSEIIRILKTNGASIGTAIKNLIWNQAYCISPFANTFKPWSGVIIEEIVAFNNTL